MSSSLHTDDDQDSLFGSPPPSPIRGRSPSQETQASPVIALPSTGVARKNVGTIALPGSHMSCAELPADLPASGLSLPRLASSHHTPSITPPTVSRTSFRAPPVVSRSSTRSVSSAPSIISSASTRKRRTPKSKSLTPAPTPLPIPLPGPNEPTPPNFLRSQSSLLGLAGLVGCVKPAQLYTHPPQSTPIRGSTQTHPIVLDDDHDRDLCENPRIQPQIPRRLDQLNPEVLRTNILNSLAQEKNIFPVLESLIKLLGGEPLPPSPDHPRLFARPYGHGIFQAQSPVSPTSGDSIPTVPPPKRRKLKHVPAGAVDWDIPFPFEAGEGPEGYRDSWARDRAKQLVTQLLELVQSATKRAAISTTKSRRARTRHHQSSRSASVETQVTETSLTRANVCESPLNIGPSPEVTVAPSPSTATPGDSLCQSLDSLEPPSTICPHAPNSDGAVEEGGPVVSCDYSAFEEWLSQLHQFMPLDPNVSAPEVDWETRSPVPLDSPASGSLSSMHALTQRDDLSASHATGDEAIDPALLAISQLGGVDLRSQSPDLSTDDISQVPDISSPSMLTHSPRTSLSSLTEPITPLSEAFTNIPSTMVNQDSDHDAPSPPSVGKDHPPQSLLTEALERPLLTGVQKGKARVSSATPSTSSRSMQSVVGGLDKQGILERARERRRQLVAEIERAKLELWETSIENAVLVHMMRDGSL